MVNNLIKLSDKEDEKEENLNARQPLETHIRYDKRESTVLPSYRGKYSSVGYTDIK
jgi:hypothetical protein